MGVITVLGNGINVIDFAHQGLVTPHGDITLGQHWLR